MLRGSAASGRLDADGGNQAFGVADAVTVELDQRAGQRPGAVVVLAQPLADRELLEGAAERVDVDRFEHADILHVGKIGHEIPPALSTDER